jgi:CheY-like chemotaxis protein
MGGQVEAVSEEGNGSTFSCTLLFGRTSADAVTGRTGTSLSGEALPFTPELLLVEDNRVNQYVARSILKKFGLQADVAENGQQALEILRQKEYDLVFMDIQMPEMDGFAATCRIRDQGSGVLCPYVPIVAMTADASREDREKCFAVGMNAYLAKPIDQDRLFAVLLQQLDGINTEKTEPDKRGEKEKNRPDIHIKTAEADPDGLDSFVDSGDLPDNLPIFDRAVFLQRMGGDEKIIDEFMTYFPGYLAEDMKALQAALHEGETEHIRACAHKVKGMCANASAERLREVARRIEYAAKQGDTAAARSLSARLEQEEKALCRYLARKN